MNSTAASATQPKSLIWSHRFNDENADVTFISSDGVRFRVNSVFLRAHSEALAPEHGSSLDEPAQLTESSEILELLFDFIYPHGEPIIKLEVDFDVLLSLAEAAAKYQVFPALYVCVKQLKAILPNHAVEILVHAYKHQYFQMVNEAIMYAIDEEPPEVLDSVPGELFKSWLKYRQQWVNVQTRALTKYSPIGGKVNISIIRLLGGKLSSLANSDSAFSAFPNPLTAWKSCIVRDVAKIPTFTKFLGWEEVDLTQAYSVKEIQCERVIIETSDGSEKYMALDVLRACTTNLGNIVNNRLQVAEKSSTIDLLLSFLKPVPSPDLEALEFTELKDLALAAEKYSVRQARGFCRVLMTKKDAIRNHPHDVFYYAAEAHYLDVLDLTAPLALGPINSFDDAIRRLPPSLISAWVLYYQQWQEAVRIFLEAVRTEGEGENVYVHIAGSPVYGHCNCRSDVTFNHIHVSPIFSRLLKEPGLLRGLDSLLAEQRLCHQARQVFDKCKVVAKDAIKAIPPLSSFVKM